VAHARCRSAPREYARAIEPFEGGALDFVLVDGIRREECARAALSKIAPGGLLVIDNANWFLPSRSRSPNSRRPRGADAHASPIWREVAEALEGWRRIWTSNGVTDTAIWIRPSGS
jgi:predicted O-methyltransferase YrrM